MLLASGFASSPSGWFVSFAVPTGWAITAFLWRRAEKRANDAAREFRRMQKRVAGANKKHRKAMQAIGELTGGYKATVRTVRKHTDELEEHGDLLTEITAQTRLLNQRMDAHDKWHEQKGLIGHG